MLAASEAHRLLAERAAARRRFDFAEADSLRHRLREDGWNIFDYPAYTLVLTRRQTDEREVPIVF